MKPITAPSALLGLGLATLLGGLGACQTRQTLRPLPDLEAQPVPAPAWIHQPLTWDKLEAIEAWLENASAVHEPSLVVEGELQLNEGRLLFTDRDARKGTLPRETLEVRLDTSDRGFAQVIANPAASPIQRQRAETGRRRVAQLLGAPPASDLALVIIPREGWDARPANPRRMTALRGRWTRITLHHSAEASSDPDGGSFEDSERTLRSIQKYHLQDPGHQWGDIGYHFIIDSSGRIFEGRELDWQGAHAGGVNNQQNIGICLLGNFERRSPRPEAIKSLELLLDELCDEYAIPRGRVYPHKNFATTACPGPKLTAFLRDYQ